MVKQEYEKRQLRNGEVVTPLGTFSEVVRERKKAWRNFTLITLLCILIVLISGGILYILK